MAKRKVGDYSDEQLERIEQYRELLREMCGETFSGNWLPASYLTLADGLQVSIYPQPAKGNFTVTVSESDLETLTEILVALAVDEDEITETTFKGV